MHRKNVVTALVLPLLISGCKQQIEPTRPVVSPAVKVVGEPGNCLRLTQFRDTKVRDDWTVDFMRNSRQGWRNTLPQRCNGLRSAGAFTYRTTASQLCRVDTINVLETTGGVPRRGNPCRLGQFVPIELEQ